MFDIRQHDDTAPAPGNLEVLQRFLNLHEHAPGDPRSLPPSREMIRGYLVDRGLLDDRERFTASDRESGLELAAALHAKVRANSGEPVSKTQLAVVDRIAQRAGLHPHFEPGGPVLVPDKRGVAGALGELVAIAFLAEFDGGFEHLRECANGNCRSVFYDRSKNHSGRWCSMRSCGNRAKVRAFRERQKAVG